MLWNLIFLHILIVGPCTISSKHFLVKTKDAKQFLIKTGNGGKTETDIKTGQDFILVPQCKSLEEGTTVILDCNTCMCLKHGNAACTKMICDEGKSTVEEISPKSTMEDTEESTSLEDISGPPPLKEEKSTW